MVSIIVCTHNRADSLNKLCLASISNLEYDNYEVVVIDDNSTDNTSQVVEKYKGIIKPLIYVKSTRKHCLSYLRNLGIKHSNGEILAFTDDDCIVDRYWLREIVRPYLKQPDIMAVGGKAYIGNTKQTFNEEGDVFGLILGCNMSFRREIFKKFVFDEGVSYFGSMGDESDILLRIKDKFRIFYNPNAVVWHFRKPAKYRKNEKFSMNVNCGYIYLKSLKIMDYYKIFFNVLLFGKETKINAPKRLIAELDSFRGIFSPKYFWSWHKLFISILILLFHAPIKAAIRSNLEKRIFSTNSGFEYLEQGKYKKNLVFKFFK